MSLIDITHQLKVTEIKDSEAIIMEILQRLSKKDLGRFKCVSKHWLSIISKPVFCFRYHRFNPAEAGTNALVTGLYLYQLRSANRSRLNFVYLNGQIKRTPSPFSISLPYVNAKSNIKRIWSCNGLFCVCMINYEFSHSAISSDGHTHTYYITNPTTNQSAKIPDFGKPLTANVLSYHLAFDPLQSPYYKVVCVWAYDAHYRFSIYSSETKGWENQGSMVASLKTDAAYNFMFKEGVFSKNVVYWVSRNGPFLCFNVENYCVQIMTSSGIKKHIKQRRIEYFGVSRNHLHLVMVDETEDNKFYIYQYGENFSKWVLKNRVDLGKIGIREDRWFGRSEGVKILSVMLCKKENQEGDHVLRYVISTPDTIYQCEPLTRGGKPSMVECGVYDKNQENLHEYNWFNAHQFSISLSSV